MLADAAAGRRQRAGRIPRGRRRPPSWIGRRESRVRDPKPDHEDNGPAEDKAEIVRRLKTVRPDVHRRWGRMSAHQMVCHLSDAFRLVTHQKAASPATGLLHVDRRQSAIALYIPLPWPAGVPTRPEMDQEAGGTKPGDFAADLAELEALLEIVTTPPAGYDWPAHPISEGCPRRRGFGGRTFTWITTCGSSASRVESALIQQRMKFLPWPHKDEVVAR